MKKITALLFIFGIIQTFSVTFSADKLWRCINEDGQTLFELKAKTVSNFSDELAAVKKAEVVNNKWVYSYGFVDQKGTTVIPFKYDKIKGKGFVNGRAWVRKKGDTCWTLIDKTGNELTTDCYEKVGFIFESNQGLMAVYKNDKLGFINQEGKLVVPCLYTGSTTFQDGLTCIAKYNTALYGFMNLKGEMEIPFQFKQTGITAFRYNGLSRAGTSKGVVLINKKGETVFATSKGDIQSISHDLVRVFTKNDRTGWGMLDMKDAWVIEPIYDKLSDFDQYGRAEAVKLGLAGLIDTTGKVLVDYQFDYMYHDIEKDGFYMGVHKTDEPKSLLNTPKVYFDKNLNPVEMNDITYIYPADGANLMSFMDNNKKMGYLNRNFEISIPAQFTKAKTFSENKAWVRVD